MLGKAWGCVSGAAESVSCRAEHWADAEGPVARTASFSALGSSRGPGRQPGHSSTSSRPRVVRALEAGCLGPAAQGWLRPWVWPGSRADQGPCAVPPHWPMSRLPSSVWDSVLPSPVQLCKAPRAGAGATVPIPRACGRLTRPRSGPTGSAPPPPPPWVLPQLWPWPSCVPPAVRTEFGGVMCLQRPSRLWLGPPTGASPQRSGLTSGFDCRFLRGNAHESLSLTKHISFT